MYFVSMKISIINGPKLNLLGSRDPVHYGTLTLDDICKDLEQSYPEISFSFFQSDVEVELIDVIREHADRSEAIILNAAAFTHTSEAIAEAVSKAGITVVEVHISNIFAREDFRHVSYPGRYCIGTIAGFGPDSYRLAVEAILLKMRG